MTYCKRAKMYIFRTYQNKLYFNAIQDFGNWFQEKAYTSEPNKKFMVIVHV
jgi:hypothetical protein